MPDVLGDRANHIRSLSVRLGPAKALQLATWHLVLECLPKLFAYILLSDAVEGNLELAVLALARIMCAYIHSQNGSAILAQARFSAKRNS